MPITENNFTVHIEDWVNGIKGSFIGWIPAHDKMPADSNEEAYQMVYYPVGDANKSWMYKFSTIVGRVLFNVLGDDAVNYTGMKVTDTVYPKSAIEGFQGGVSFNNPNNADDVPSRRVILYHDKDGNAPYAEKFAPGNTDAQAKIQELKDEKSDLKQKLDAADIQLDELDNKKEKDDDNNGQRRDDFNHFEVMNDGELQ